MPTSKTYKVPGYPLMTGHQMRVMAYLVEHDDEHGAAWCNLEQFDVRTMKSLQRHDYIVASQDKHNKRIAYRITGRGRDAYIAISTYRPKQYRRDGLCRTCGKNPRESGSYCLECQRVIKRDYYAKRSHEILYGKMGKPCQKCGKHPISVQTMCRKCHSQRVITANRRRAGKIMAGELPMPICPRCNERPVHVTPTRVQSYCKPCRREYSAENRAVRLKHKLRRIQLSLRSD